MVSGETNAPHSGSCFLFALLLFLLLPGDPAPAANGTLFPPATVWYQRAEALPVHPDSKRVIGWMSRRGNSFAPHGEFRIDLSLRVLQAKEDTAMRSFRKTKDFFADECDEVPVPLPEGGTVEGNPTYRCGDDGDCHLIVIHRQQRRLYEMWRASISSGNAAGGTFSGGCLVVWNLDRTYGWEAGRMAPAAMMGRGRDCTSADAAGLPIAPLLFTPVELERGHIGHALRFVLPNRNIRHRAYTAPATHATGAAKGA
jgi:hypothetical protein